MRVIQYLICGFILALLVQHDPVLASDSDTEPVLIYIDPVTGKYRMGSPSEATVTTSTVQTEINGVTMGVETLSDIGFQRTIIIGTIIFVWLLIAPCLIHKKYFRVGS